MEVFSSWHRIDQFSIAVRHEDTEIAALFVSGRGPNKLIPILSS